MYKIKVKGEEEYIEAVNRKLDQDENVADILNFTIYPNSKYFNKLKKYKTKIVVTQDIGNDEVEIFEGRVIDSYPSMDNSGLVTENIVCASILDYLTDVKVGKWQIHPDEYQQEESTEESTDPFIIYKNMSAEKYLKLILDTYNSKVKDEQKIFLGQVTVNEFIYCQNNRESCLNAITEKLINKKGGFLKIRKLNNLYYLDYLESLDLEETKIELTQNMSSLSQKCNLDKYITRVIPIGADGITIASINDGKEYIEDTNLIGEYGVIEEVIEFSDVTIKENLISKARRFLEQYNENVYAIECGALDVSLIRGDFKGFMVSQTCNIINPLLNLNTKQRIISKSTPLDEPWNVTLKFSIAANKVSSINTRITQESNNTKLEMTVLGDKIVNKVGKGELSTIVEQNAESWGLSIDGKLRGNTYSFDGVGFHLGATDSSSVVTHTNEYSEYRFEDGSKARIDKNGFYNMIGSSKNEYHHLNYTSEVTMLTESNGVFEATIQLPDEFKNKKVAVVPIITDSYIPPNYMGMVIRSGAWLKNHDKDTGKITIRGQCSMVYLNNVKDDGTSIYYGYFKSFGDTPYPAGGVNITFHVSVTA